MDTVSYNNISSADMGVFLQTPPVYIFPERNIESVQIPGRNGDLLIDKNTYKNVKRSYYMGIQFRNKTTFYQNIARITEWLNSANGYVRLEDSYDPEHYRLAVYSAGGEFTNYQDTVTLIMAAFECKPQRYLKTGDIPIKITGTNTKIKNHTNCDALPIINVTASNLVLKIENKTNVTRITITSETQKTITINSEVNNCYNGDENMNPLVKLEDGFPVLYPGETTITVESGTYQSLEIIPKWWRL